MVFVILISLTFYSKTTFGNDLFRSQRKDGYPEFTIYSYTAKDAKKSIRLLVVNTLKWVYLNQDKRIMYLYTKKDASSKCVTETFCQEYSLKGDTLVPLPTRCHNVKVQELEDYFKAVGTITNEEVVPVEKRKSMKTFTPYNMLVYFYNEGYLDH